MTFAEGYIFDSGFADIVGFGYIVVGQIFVVLYNFVLLCIADYIVVIDTAGLGIAEPDISAAQIDYTFADSCIRCAWNLLRIFIAH